MDKKDNLKIIIVILILVILGISIINLTSSLKDIPRRSNASYKVMDIKNCLNQKDGWGFNSDCTIKIKNLEPYYPIQFTPLFSCYKLSEPNKKETIRAETKAIVAGKTEEFKIEYKNKGREWSCELKDPQATNIPS